MPIISMVLIVLKFLEGGIFCKYTSTLVAWSRLILGLFEGLCRFILEMIFISRDDNFLLLDAFILFNYLLFGACLFFFTHFVMLVITLLTPKSFHPNLQEVKNIVLIIQIYGISSLLNCLG